MSAQVAAMQHEILGHAVAMDRAVPRKDGEEGGGGGGGAPPPRAGAMPGAEYGMMEGYAGASPLRTGSAGGQ